MRFSLSSPRRPQSASLVVLVLLSAATVPALRAGEVVLRNGTRIESKLKPARVQGLTFELFSQSASEFTHYPIWMVHTGMQRYFVPDRQVQDASFDINPSFLNLEGFELPPHQKSGRSQMLAQIGTFSDVTEFDEFGRRRVTVRTSDGEIHIVQGVKSIDPKHVILEGLTHHWECAIATNSFPPAVLDRIIRKVMDPRNPDNRMAIARFYLQAGFYPQSAAELDSIARDFPELKPRVEELLTELRTLQANELLSEVRRRRAAGQHRLAAAAVQRFPTANMSPVVLRDLRQLEEEIKADRNEYDKVLLLLSELQMQLEEKQQEAVEPLRTVVRDRLDLESLARMDAFLKLHTDPTLTPAEKLGLAYSGWVVGSANAVDDLEVALQLWKAQFLVLEYLRSNDSVRRETLLADLRDLESVGPERVVQMIPHLPPIVETAGVEPGVPYTVEIPAPDSSTAPTKYSVLLPAEYTPHHAYPLIVALRPPEVSAEQLLEWWEGQAQRHGYVVIAPEYADAKATQYDYGAAAHAAVLDSLIDARRRFHIDSDRIFLSGHGMGGDAVFDIVMSHPDLFAGAIPINGLCDQYCKYYWENGESTVPWYIVSGELSRSSLQNNTTHASTLNRMMRHGHDLIYAEYIGRGYESYFGELPKLFEWMARMKRAPLPKEISVQTLRPGDNRFYWVQCEGLPAQTLRSVVVGDKPRWPVSPMQLEVRISDGSAAYNVITISKSGAQKNILWLSPEVVSFEKRLQVRQNRRTRFNDFLEPDVGTMLEDLRVRGDRQRLFTAKVVVE